MQFLAHGRKHLRRLGIAFGAVALVGAAACAAKVDEAPKEGVAKQELETGCHGHFKSPLKTVLEATRAHGDLSEEQIMALDAIAGELENEHESFRALRDKIKLSAVSVVRAGTTDSEEFDLAVAEAVDALEQRFQQGTDALIEIHAMLDADQRVAVAEALHAQIDERFGRRKEREVRRREDGFKRFASHLMLSSLQVDQLKMVKKELIGEARELRPSSEELHGLVDAFEGDDFAAALQGFHDAKSKILRARIARASEKTETVLSIFTQEQRELIADLILEGPSKVLLGEEAVPAEQE